MRFKKQLEGFCPPSSISAMTMPVVLSSDDTNNRIAAAADAAVAASASMSLSIATTATPAMVSTPDQEYRQASTDGDGLFSADALARLFSVDMFPQTNAPKADALHVANSYMTPFSQLTPYAEPEWTKMHNTEANMLANLGDMALAGQESSSQEWMPVGFNDVSVEDNSAELLSQHLLDGEAMFTTGTNFESQGFDNILPSLGMPTPTIASSLPLHMQNITSSGRPSAYPIYSNVSKSTSGPSLPTASAAAAVLTASVEMESKDYSKPSAGIDLPISKSPGSGLQSPISTWNGTNTHRKQSQDAPGSPDKNNRSFTNGPSITTYPPTSTVDLDTDTKNSASPSPSIDNIPQILKEYVSRIPGNPSASAIYRIMRETFKAPRMGMVSLNLELLWYMLHKGVLPRIVFYGHISSTIRCNIADLDVKKMVPPHIDESCYKLALEEVSLVKDCSAIWGAIGLCMITRYEFQSSRYKEMAEHVDMALDIMHRIKFMGHSYPWHTTAAKDKESFGFQYLIAIYWKCFWWKLISRMLIEQHSSIGRELEQLPGYSSKSFDLYTVDQPYDEDLMEMIPPNSWNGADKDKLPDIRFRGPSDPEFMSLRPPNSPCFDRASTNGAYMQQLLVIYSRFFAMQCQARRGEIELCQLLKGLWAFREHMDVWRNSLPPEMILDNKLVSDYLETINPESAATFREIDLKASRLKDVIMMLLAYHTFLVRANRFVMKMMLGEPLDTPPPDVGTMGFAIRDLYDSQSSPKVVTEGLGYMNIYFHGCRIQAIKSANALCSIVQAAYSCKFNFYTLGSQMIFTIFEILVVYVSFLGNHDENIAWRSKSRLSNVFNILRMLRHWAPALHIFVAGIKALSDPRFCLDEPKNFNTIKQEVLNPAMLDMSDPPIDSAEVTDDENGTLPPKRRRVVRLPQALEFPNDARANIQTSITPHGSIRPSSLRRDETLSYRAADPIPEFPNPFPRRHIISLIIGDLGLSLAEFLAPAYPILLLKLMPSRDLYPSRSQMFGSIR
ncbi:hypothetical protein COEREDRAFT_82391 [Coemansia reversa NRRL 1564]|uniref:Uncharacterized protein n=1 Tax=Coemansia reversa (strain ATCC 12441 / NRRL 1564) TaxID=763665 RepID=A0A2G5B7J0_COERN|nr:hypothetical protein COEREDRAFT_82391 [Coemansia reversa NRRL 1564]|eukprot:PIA14975.1 hypothetical protein COEREDRAFT_82391 [Coemansia reversa NRRL 1564]